MAYLMIFVWCGVEHFFYVPSFLHYKILTIKTYRFILILNELILFLKINFELSEFQNSYDDLESN